VRKLLSKYAFQISGQSELRLRREVPVKWLKIKSKEALLEI